MTKAHFIQALHDRYFPKTCTGSKIKPHFAEQLESLNLAEKHDLAQNLLSMGEEQLLSGSLSALDLFDRASMLDAKNPDLWFRQGLALFEHGESGSKDKTLFLACKNFKIASKLAEERADIWWAWGNVLYLIGESRKESHYFVQAKNKYQRALELAANASKETLCRMHWDNGSAWLSIAEYSGEAIDIRTAIESFRVSAEMQTEPPPDFWNDFGRAYLQMALLINENRLYFQAIEYFEKALEIEPRHRESILGLAHANTELYTNTQDSKYFHAAGKYYEKQIACTPKDPELYLEWAQLLGAFGKEQKDRKALKLSLDKCARACRDDLSVIAQKVESLSWLGAYTNQPNLILEAESKILAATEKFPEVAELWYACGICYSAFAYYYNSCEYEEIAIEKLQKAISCDRADSEIWHAIARCHSNIGNQYEDWDILERAIKFYQKAIEFKPACPALIFDLAKTLFFLGKITNETAFLEQAQLQFEIILRGQNDALMQHPEWIFYYACTLDLLGELSDEDESYYCRAIEAFNNVLLIDPDYPAIYYHMALSFSHLAMATFETRAFRLALNYFKIAAKQDEENDTILLEWGLTLTSVADQLSENEGTMRTNYFAEAEQKLTQSGMLGNQMAYYHLACFYSLTGKPEKSLHFLQEAKVMDVLPPLEELMEDEWLENVRATKAFAGFLITLENKEKSIDDR